MQAETMESLAGKLVGIVGVPPLAVIRQLLAAGAEMVDLDEPQVRKSIDLTASYLPRVYCAVLRTVVLNAMHLDLEAIFIDVGPGKCDCALHVSRILQRFCPKVVTTRNTDSTGFGYSTCRCRMDLAEKFACITAHVRKETAPPPRPSCTPTAGFWGVPPRDFSILSLFPETTHVYGWTRCMENKTPADLDLEAHFNPSVPTVFFAQAFCAKTALARHLADLHPCSLYLDCDVTASGSVRAKIEAFLELSGAGKTD